MITQALCRSVAAGLKRGLMTPETIVLVWTRIRGVENRLLALVARMRDGRLRMVPEGSRMQPSGGAGAVSGASVFPVRFAWLVPLVPSDAACFANHLRILLAEPGMVALLRDVPQAARILTPLCRMLGVERDLLHPAPDAAASESGDGNGATVPQLPAEFVGEARVDPAPVAGSLAFPAWVRFIPG
jgi:hypothetical protein